VAQRPPLQRSISNVDNEALLRAVWIRIFERLLVVSLQGRRGPVRAYLANGGRGCEFVIWLAAAVGSLPLSFMITDGLSTIVDPRGWLLVWFGSLVTSTGWALRRLRGDDKRQRENLARRLLEQAGALQREFRGPERESGAAPR
jgi:hypothetical protein